MSKVAQHEPGFLAHHGLKRLLRWVWQVERLTATDEAGSRRAQMSLLESE